MKILPFCKSLKALGVCTLFCMAYSNSDFAQGTGNNWYFGVNAGISFNTSPPSVLHNSAMNTYEGCATISDGTGNLLFYTDGVSVFTKHHTIMRDQNSSPVNYLKGYNSTAQSAIIVPEPGNENRYYIFTSDAIEFSGAKGINYVIVDMAPTQNGGLGKVLCSLRNPGTQLFAPASEKLVAIRHANCSDYWIVAHEYTTATFRIYKLTASGIDLAKRSASHPDGYLTYEGISSHGFFQNPAAYMKASQDGSLIADVARNEGVHVYNFDNAGGTMSNPHIAISAGAVSNPYYGVEFSAENEYIYCSQLFTTFFTGKVHKIALPITFDNPPVTETFDSPEALVTALQMGPDGTIYCAKLLSGNQPSRFLATISQSGSAQSGYINQAIDLREGIDANAFVGSQGGLPPIIYSCEPLINAFTEPRKSNTQLQITTGPMQNTINVKYIADENIQGSVFLEIREVSGRLVSAQAFNKLEENVVDISQMSAGIYLLSVKNKSKALAISKFAKQ